MNKSVRVDGCVHHSAFLLHRSSFIVHRSSFLDQSLSVIAVFHNGTAFAEWVAGAAEGAAVAYEVDVEGVEFSGWDEGVHDVVGAAVGAFLGDEADAAQDAEDVRVEGEDFRAAGEEERAGDGLGADAAKLGEVFYGFCGRESV